MFGDKQKYIIKKEDGEEIVYEEGLFFDVRVGTLRENLWTGTKELDGVNVFAPDVKVEPEDEVVHELLPMFETRQRRAIIGETEGVFSKDHDDRFLTFRPVSSCASVVPSSSSIDTYSNSTSGGSGATASARPQAKWLGFPVWGVLYFGPCALGWIVFILAVVLYGRRISPETDIMLENSVKSLISTPMGALVLMLFTPGIVVTGLGVLMIVVPTAIAVALPAGLFSLGTPQGTIAGAIVVIAEVVALSFGVHWLRRGASGR